MFLKNGQPAVRPTIWQGTIKLVETIGACQVSIDKGNDQVRG